MLDPVRKTVYQNLLKSAVILEMGDLSAQNKRQVSDLFAGVVRMQRLLDFYIDHLVAKKANIKVQTLLRMAMYELTQTQIPPYALVSEYVNLAKKYQPKAASFVNAILRKASKTHFELPKEWGILYSHPNWLIKRWIKSYGEVATEALLQWNNARPKHTLRINTLKTDIQTYKKQLDELEIDWEEAKWLVDAVVVQNIQPLLQTDFVVQDEAAAIVVRVANPQQGMKILDACAAPGGKSSYMATLMQNEGEILALDRSENRVQQMEAGFKAQGITIVTSETVDFLTFESAEKFDLVLLDVPCTGTGVMAKRADIRWKRSPEQLTELLDLQQKMLEKGKSFVKSGGYLVYSTCSIEKEENEVQIEQFLSRNSDFEKEDISQLIPSDFIQEGYYFSFPPNTGFDGAFAAKLRKK